MFRRMISPNWKTLAVCCGAWAACASMAQPVQMTPQAAPARQQAAELLAPGQQALTAWRWRLQAVRGKDHAWFTRAAAALSEPVVLRFDEAAVRVVAPCNQLRGRYLLSGERMLIEPLMGTKKGCADARLMALEDRLEQILPTVKDWRLQTARQQSGQPAASLRLRFINGSEWLLQGEPAGAAAADSPLLAASGQAADEALFLEVAPHTQPCGSASQQQCLLARQVRFDASGARQSQADGPWLLLAQPIEGFVHEPGARTVLRVRRQPRGAGYVLQERISYEMEP